MYPAGVRRVDIFINDEVTIEKRKKNGNCFYVEAKVVRCKILIEDVIIGQIMEFNCLDLLMRNSGELEKKCNM